MWKLWCSIDVPGSAPPTKLIVSSILANEDIWLQMMREILRSLGLTCAIVRYFGDDVLASSTSEKVSNPNATEWSLDLTFARVLYFDGDMLALSTSKWVSNPNAKEWSLSLTWSMSQKKNTTAAVNDTIAWYDFMVWGKRRSCKHPRLDKLMWIQQRTRTKQVCWKHFMIYEWVWLKDAIYDWSDDWSNH